MKKEKLTKMAMAKKCRIDYNTLERILNSSPFLRVVSLLKVSDILGIDFIELFNEK